jgi:1-acyl-sn-glycerol-3-phosphate acyltransferase
MTEHSLARQLAALSASEMVSALGVQRAPALLQQGLSLPFYWASRALGETLAELDQAVGTRGLPAAAAQALGRFGIALHTTGTQIGKGAHLVLANHPGAYDALALMSALGREDLLILAAERRFLRALPRLSTHLLFVGEHPAERAGALKRAVGHLRRGGALLHFPAGQIEPDADFEPETARLLKPWQPGVATLLKACAHVDGRAVLAGVRGVHSPRAKRWLLNRLAERRGITTLSPLLQMVGRLRDVATHVRCVDAERADELSRLSPSEQQLRLRAALVTALRRDAARTPAI